MSETISQKMERLRALEPNSIAWAKARQEDVKVSASECAAAIGQPGASYSRAHLWRFKTGRVNELVRMTPFLRDLFQHGHNFEDLAAQRFQELVRPFAKLESTGIWLYGGDPRIGATPDRLVTESTGVVVPLEIKNPVELTTEATPERVEKDLIQLRVQMRAMGAPYGYLFYYWQKNDTHECYIAYNDDEKWESIYQRLWVFLHYVEKDEEPPRLSKAAKEKEFDLYWLHHAPKSTTSSGPC